MNSTETTTKPLSKKAFNPGKFYEPGTPGGPKLIMATPTWAHIQTFVANAKALPITTAALKSQMGPGAPSDMSDFDKLVTFYGIVQAQADTFHNTTYPAIVDLSSDLETYANNINGLYSGLKQEIAKYKTYGPGNPIPKAVKTTIQTNISAVVAQLASSIAPYKKKVKDRKADLATFVSNIEADNLKITGKTGLSDYYNNKYGKESTKVTDIIAKLATQNTKLKTYQSEYDKDRLLAETSPAYLAIPFVGIIAAPIAAGVFGKKATDALNEVKATKATIDALDAKKKADARMLSGLLFATTRLTSLSTELTNVTNTIETMEGTWGDIETKLNAIVSLITHDFDTTISFLLTIDFNQLIKDWEQLVVLTMKFSTAAYITVGNND